VTSVIPPGSTIGVLGGGQLGRMLTTTARKMGYQVHTFSPEKDTPTGQVANLAVSASYEDLDALRGFASQVQVVTLEFENIPIKAIDAVESLAPVRPSGTALQIAQQRTREKNFLANHGFPTVPFASAVTLDELQKAVKSIGTPVVIKTAEFGYDGKGQHQVSTLADVENIWNAIGHREVLVEKFVSLQSEVSVIAARGLDGTIAEYMLFKNCHRNHILDVATAPADVDKSIAVRAVEIARGILDQLQYFGVLCVEYFITTGGDLLVNELAPRTHNSGHLTLEACATSQFEQQVRAICGLPLGSTELLQPAAMANLLGDLWVEGEPNWAAAELFPEVKLHLYGKKDPRRGRKMGHLTALGRTTEEAKQSVMSARKAVLS
tara:strand:+ start:21222 stop:22358 length:1137 start_codon:yes stop_codon:yes gene_type:complete